MIIMIDLEKQFPDIWAKMQELKMLKQLAESSPGLVAARYASYRFDGPTPT